MSQRVGAVVLVVLGAGPMFPADCDCDDVEQFFLPPPGPQQPEAAIRVYIRAHSDESGMQVEDPVSGERWRGEPTSALPDIVLPSWKESSPGHSDEVPGRACQRFRARLVERGTTTETVEVCFELRGSETSGWTVSAPSASPVPTR